MIDLKTRNREALKALRGQRAAETESVQAKLKEQIKRVNAITATLKNGPMTVPALAKATGLGTEIVFWQLMSLKKYGKVAEGEQDGDYFQYRLL